MATLLRLVFFSRNHNCGGIAFKNYSKGPFRNPILPKKKDTFGKPAHDKNYKSLQLGFSFEGSTQSCH